MGVSDNTVQTETSKDTSSSNGNHHPEERLVEALSQKRPYTDPNGQLKCKRCRVSAVRDFPPGCGNSSASFRLSSGQEEEIGKEADELSDNGFVWSSESEAEPSANEESDGLVQGETERQRDNLESIDEMQILPHDGLNLGASVGTDSHQVDRMEPTGFEVVEAILPPEDTDMVENLGEAIVFEPVDSQPLSMCLPDPSLSKNTSEEDIGMSDSVRGIGAVPEQFGGTERREAKKLVTRVVDVGLPPLHPNGASSRHGSRNRVKEILRRFHAVCRKLLQEEETKPRDRKNGIKSVEYQAAKILRDRGIFVNTGKQIIGSVPGIEVGYEFQYRMELNLIGLHRPSQGSVAYVKEGEQFYATSIVASGGYGHDDELHNSDILIYTGQCGDAKNGGEEPEDQMLERGNLALANSRLRRNPVRVIRSNTRAADSSEARAGAYVYDGLYIVEELWRETGTQGELVLKYKLQRVPGQPELPWKIVKKSEKSKLREGVCKLDISEGKERLPICAVNGIDDEQPPSFIYTVGTIYPDGYNPVPPKGCDCTTRCSESRKCSCAVKNGGRIPYNRDGAIVEAMPVVYECGPHCKCPSSCYNRVSQHGIRFKLEIFKTESIGWGVRSLNSIPSGSFICEYAGELLEEEEAERRTGNDGYLFDIGNDDDGNNSSMPEGDLGSVEESCAYTIDAAGYGNVGRFINHSCCPNLYAQDVLFDHGDTRIPRVMLFALDNIPPLQELTYHYNYAIGQVRDRNGNVMKKDCHCGSSDCVGRLY